MQKMSFNLTPIAMAIVFTFSISSGHAHHISSHTNGNNGNNGNNGKIGICHLEADGSYTLLQLKTIPAMNHLENHSFGGEGDRVASENGDCVFEVDIDGDGVFAVSYTHLTLPTICSV